MTQTEFKLSIDRHAQTLSAIRKSAHALHASVNQTYDKRHPYGFHLDMVAETVSRYGSAVCESDAVLVPLLFAAYYHRFALPPEMLNALNDVMR